jgi:hypothetical protein
MVSKFRANRARRYLPQRRHPLHVCLQHHFSSVLELYNRANRQTYPMCIVGNHSNWAAHRLIRYEEVAELARRCTCPHREVSAWKPRSIEDAFIRLVRAGWAFEREKEAERVKLEREFEEQQKNLALLDALAVPDENSVGLPQPTGMDSSVHPLLRDEERLRPGRPGLLGIVEETGGN